MKYGLGWFTALASRVVFSNGDPGIQNKTEKQVLVEAAEQAKREWVAAKEYFESVSEPELVDYAIYLQEAAQRKYVYLLKKARENKADIEMGA